MKAYASNKPGDSGDEVYVEPVFDGTNSYLEKRFEVLPGVLSSEEVLALKEFIGSKLPKSSEDEFSQTLVLPYRPDEWDSIGVVQKVQDISRSHIVSTYAVSGQLEPVKFKVMRTDNVQKYLETYGKYNDNREILYTAITTVPSPVDHYSGETLYQNNGEGFRPNPGDLVIHRNETLNNWEIVGAANTPRFDLLIMFREVDRSISYDYVIDQTKANLYF